MAHTDTAEQPGLLRRLGALVLTLLTIGFAGALVFGGSGVIAERAAKDTESTPTPPVFVETSVIRIEDTYSLTTTYRGRVEAGRRVDIGFETGGTVTEVLVDEGDQVRAGDILARLDTASLDARRAAEVAARDALIAQAELARRTLVRQAELNARDFASAQRLDEAELTLARLEAELRRAEAAIVATDVAIGKSILTAPFDAEIGARQVDDGTRAQPGQAVLTVFEATDPRFRVGLPEDVALTVSEGDEITVTLAGRPYGAQVDRIRSDINTATRTRDVVLTLPSETPAAEGMLGTVAIVRNVPGQGAWVPVTALSEGARGLWTLFVVADGVTAREAVELVHLDGARAYVRGNLTDGDVIVASGPHRIAAGQTIAQAGS